MSDENQPKEKKQKPAGRVNQKPKSGQPLDQLKRAYEPGREYKNPKTGTQHTDN